MIRGDVVSGWNGKSWTAMNIVVYPFDGKDVNVKAQPLPPIPKELFDLFDIHELEKYMTPEEIAKGGSN